MLLRFNSALLAYAAEFAGDYGPDRGIEVAPLIPGADTPGVTVSAFNRGAIGMIGYDPSGCASQRVVLLPEPDLVRAAKGIKSAERDISIEGDDPRALSARVTTYYKAHSTFKDFTVCAAGADATHPYREAVGAVLKRWGTTPSASSTAGRYDIGLLLSAVKAMVDDSDSLVVSGYDGGPLRLQREDLQMVVLLMPQAAVPIPPAPEWLASFCAASHSVSDACQVAQTA